MATTTHSTEVVVTNNDKIKTYKVLVIGDSNVGKTALLNRVCEGSFAHTFISTVGIDYKNKIVTLDDEDIKLQIWDTAGQERFRTLTNAYFRGADGAVVLYDITSRESYTNVAGWMDSVCDHGSPNICSVVVGHKCDLQDERVISIEEGRKLAENYDSLFFEASAKNGTNCSKIFTRLAQNIKSSEDSALYVGPNSSRNALTESSLLDHPPQKSSSCC